MKRPQYGSTMTTTCEGCNAEISASVLAYTIEWAHSRIEAALRDAIRKHRRTCPRLQRVAAHE